MRGWLPASCVAVMLSVMWLTHHFRLLSQMFSLSGTCSLIQSVSNHIFNIREMAETGEKHVISRGRHSRVCCCSAR